MYSTLQLKNFEIHAPQLHRFSPAGNVLGVKDESIESDTEVVLQAKNESVKGGQTWLRGPADIHGWSTLTNVKSGKLLTRSLVIFLEVAYIKGLYSFLNKN